VPGIIIISVSALAVLWLIIHTLFFIIRTSKFRVEADVLYIFLNFYPQSQLFLKAEYNAGCNKQVFSSKTLKKKGTGPSCRFREKRIKRSL